MKKIRKKILGYEAIFEVAPEGGYDVYFPKLTGCVTFGNNLKQTEQAAKEALTL
jgi:predicted RNase H-like HicB family nuclease